MPIVVGALAELHPNATFSEAKATKEKSAVMRMEEKRPRDRDDRAA